VSLMLLLIHLYYNKIAEILQKYNLSNVIYIIPMIIVLKLNELMIIWQPIFFIILLIFGILIRDNYRRPILAQGYTIRFHTSNSKRLKLVISCLVFLCFINNVNGLKHHELLDDCYDVIEIRFCKPICADNVTHRMSICTDEGFFSDDNYYYILDNEIKSFKLTIPRGLSKLIKEHARKLGYSMATFGLLTGPDPTDAMWSLMGNYISSNYEHTIHCLAVVQKFLMINSE